MIRVHGVVCRCHECRHARFNPGPPTKPVGWCGNLKVGADRKRFRINQLHEQALRENAEREKGG